MSDHAYRLSAKETARLAVLQRLSMGTAHAVNNALTAAMGEAGFLYEDHKESPEIAEACQAILSSLDRCARLSQALLAHIHPATDSAESEADLVRVVRDLERWLREAIGSRSSLVVEAPDDLALVAAPEDELQLLVMGLVSFAADRDGGASDLGLRVEPGDAGEPVGLRLSVSSEQVCDETLAALEAPRRAAQARAGLVPAALRELVLARGGSWHVARIDPQSWALIVRLPTPA